jgi:ADP-ribose pyrophosphatase YjhB (NUDIX family)
LEKWCRKILHVLYRLRSVYWWLVRPLTLGVKGLVIDQEGRVLLVKHGYQAGWHLPGGLVERGENLEQAMEREVWEETGIDCSGNSRRLLGIYANFNEYKYDHVAVFVVEQASAAGLKRRWLEIEECGFFRLTQLPTDATSATRKRLDEYLGKAPVSVAW